MTLVASRLDTVKSHYPVLIIGGGINGCGVFRDLTAQGIDCLLVDKGDFCSGASAAPSRLIHGGIKYLETGEFRLVRQSAIERNLLLKNAPHYVKPLETVLPVYSWFGGIIPSIKRFFGLKAVLNDRGAIITEIGLSLYDLFGRHFRTMPKHRMLLRRSIASAMPELTAKAIASGVYYEGRITHAERLGLELIIDAMEDNPASIALNYVSVSGACGSGIILTDELTGRDLAVNADVVINAGGAWIDAVNENLGIKSQYMGGNKGSHLIVRNARLHNALGGRMIYFGSADGRVNLIYPFMGNVLVGSTDIPVEDPDCAVCDDTERQYLLNVTREVFPDIEMRPDEIIMTYCGVRPLPRSEGIAAGEISRDHSIKRDLIPKTETLVLSLIGGKWTTYRGFSEEAADIVLSILGKARSCSTRDLSIGGGKDFPMSAPVLSRFIEDLSRVTGIRQVAADLFDRYGTRARLVADDKSKAALASLPAYSRSELAWICSNEYVSRLTDLLFRRTDIALSGRLSGAVITEAAKIASDALGWNAERQKNEIEATSKVCQSHGIAI
jgi:glycerol-3-phosphate dehydrogenase